MNLFVFHNDLRLDDNKGFKAAIDSGKTIPIFIFTQQQIGKQNKYRSQRCIDFMCKSIEEVDRELRKHGSRMHIYHGETHVVIKRLIKQHGIVAVYSNKNYTPFAIERDKLVKKVCDQCQIPFNEFDDYVLFPPGSVVTGTGAYKKYTPFLNAVQHLKVEKPNHYSVKNVVSVRGSGNPLKSGKEGGRREGLALLKRLPDRYGQNRNFPHIETSHISAYIKFGCVSPREVYREFKLHGQDLVKQLIWREFYFHLTYGYPHVLVGANRNFKKKFSSVKWIRLTSSNKKVFEKWCKGETGYPIVDASMRQLNQTGWMHNRGRLIVAWFLTKVMGWHWMYGELYFARNLKDYDPCVNNGNWQFCAGSGVDTDQYFRLFNPWAQSEKYDKDALYIKKWLPELKSVDPHYIHHWYKFCDEYKIRYPKPMLDYEDSKEKIKRIYGRFE